MDREQVIAEIKKFPPEHQSVAFQSIDLWDRAIALRNQGYTYMESHAQLGVDPPQNQNPFSWVRLQDVPWPVREKLIEQAKKQLIDQLHGASLDRWPTEIKRKVEQFIADAQNK